MWIAGVTAVLDLAPPLVLVAAFVLGRRRPRVWLAVGAFGAVVIAITVTATHAGIVFRDPRLGLAWLCLTYILYLAAVGCTILVRRKLVMILLVLMASVPMAFGYFLGTVGSLGVMFLVSEMLEPPSAIEVLHDGLVCESGFWGVAGSGGTEITIYRDVPGFPFLRRQVTGKAVPDMSGDEISCADAPALAAP